MQQRHLPGRRLFALVTSTLFLAASAGILHAATVCNVRDYGAKGNGTTKDTAAIQGAINACEQKGGGTVLMPPGTYLSAPIVLKSNITFHLDKGATLLGSPDHADYPAITEFRAPGLQALVSATDASNVTIDGQGTINGNGESWWKMAWKIRGTGILGTNHPRPRLVVFNHCNRVLIQGVTIENSPMWQVVPYYSNDVTIRNVRILAAIPSPNTDAIDPFSSSNVVIENVYADVGDDDVAIKSGMINSPGPDSPSTNITIRNCIFMHGHGLSVGSELAGGAHNILAENIEFNGTDNGIRVKANRDRGHPVYNLVFRNIKMKNVKNALIISEYYPHVMPPSGVSAAPITRLTPHFSNIVLQNVTATDSTNAGAIVGLPESPVKDVVLDNVAISAQKGMAIGYANVSGQNVEVKAAEGAAITKLAGATISFK